MMALETEIIFLKICNHRFTLTVIYTNFANMLVALFSYALIYYIMQ